MTEIQGRSQVGSYGARQPHLKIKIQHKILIFLFLNYQIIFFIKNKVEDYS